MTQTESTSPITIRTGKDTVERIDAVAGVMERSRNYVVNQAIEEYLAAHTWQIERIQAGLEDARAGRVVPADEVFAKIRAKYGWDL
jgi:predicted transcriptional regulator